jgi:hypothetical protein
LVQIRHFSCKYVPNTSICTYIFPKYVHIFVLRRPKYAVLFFFGPSGCARQKNKIRARARPELRRSRPLRNRSRGAPGFLSHSAGREVIYHETGRRWAWGGTECFVFKGETGSPAALRFIFPGPGLKKISKRQNCHTRPHDRRKAYGS